VRKGKKEQTEACKDYYDSTLKPQIYYWYSKGDEFFTYRTRTEEANNEYSVYTTHLQDHDEHETYLF